MKTIKLKDEGSDVLQLQQLLCKWGYTVNLTSIFDDQTDKALRSFQKEMHLVPDGIAGANTWKMIQDESARTGLTLKLSDADFTRAATSLQVETAAIRAVAEVETGGRGGFLDPAHPTILFEGHIFWSQLKSIGINPETYQAGNEDILYPKWTKSYYKGGIKEYDRLERAKKINEKAANASASWGMFQIMGFNYAACGTANVYDFVAAMKINEGKQLDLFAALLKKNGWDKSLRALNWAEFARQYNGPAYAQNRYDEKLLNAYNKYHKG